MTILLKSRLDRIADIYKGVPSATKDDTSVLGDLSVTSGVVQIGDDVTLSVGGNADLQAGLLGFFPVAQGGDEVIDVEGDVTCLLSSVTSSALAACAPGSAPLSSSRRRVGTTPSLEARGRRRSSRRRSLEAPGRRDWGSCGARRCPMAASAVPARPVDQGSGLSAVPSLNRHT